MLLSSFYRLSLASLLFVTASAAVCAQEKLAENETPAAVATVDEPSGFTRNDAVIASFTIFVLAIFVGFEVITKVPPTLHTPLMSGSNAISGITLVGALVVAGSGRSDLAAWLGVLAIAFATINVVGGFWVTHRMLSMFKRR